MCLVSATFLHHSETLWSLSPIFLARKPSATLWRNEGAGRLRWVLSLSCHVDFSGCNPEVEGAGHHCPPHLQATGGNRTKTPGPGTQPALRTLACSGMKIGQIEDVTRIPSGSTHRKGVTMVAVSEQHSSNYCFLLILPLCKLKKKVAGSIKSRVLCNYPTIYM